MMTFHPLGGFLCALLITASTQAQITFEFADLPVAGDVITRYTDTLPSIGPGAAGADQVWDLSAALIHETTVTTVSTAASTPAGAQFPGSQLAYTNDGTNYLYFSVDATSMVARGFSGDPLQQGQTLVVPFAPTLKVHDLPRTYGSSFTDNYYFEVVADGSAFGVHSVRLRHRGTVFDSTDAHGQVSTPLGSYDALRVKTTEYSSDSIWIRLLSFAPWTFVQASSDTSVAYTWLAKETKLPVAEMTLDSLGNPARLIHSSIPPAITTDVEEAQLTGLHIYPQPATHGFFVEFDHPLRTAQFEVLSADGRLMRRLATPLSGRVWIGTEEWPRGMYFIRSIAADASMPTVVRVLVQ